MLVSADADLVRRDPAIPGLRLVLDPAALLERLLPAFPPDVSTPTSGEIVYLRYKPGTSLLAGYQIETPAGRTLAWAKAWGPGAEPKLAATQRVGARDVTGFGVVVDEELRLALGTDASDRALPGVALLRQPPGMRRRLRLPNSLATATLHALRYKPERRWVAVAHVDGSPSALVKAHPPGLAHRPAAVHQALLRAGLPVPGLLGHDRRHGLVAVDWVPGDLPTQGALPAVGAALARWHVMGALDSGHPVGPTAALARAIGAVEAVAPGYAPAAARAAARAGVDLGGMRLPRRLVHGDLSADQVLVAGDQVTFVDLDRAGAGDPAADLGSWAATEMVEGRHGLDDDPLAVLAPLLEGYGAGPAAAVRPRLAPWTAVALLQRAVEPFRLRLPDWDERVHAVVRAALRISESR